MVGESAGILLGGSSGLNLHAARVLSSHIKEGIIVTVLCDSGVKYLSKIFNDEWLNEKNLDKPLKQVSDYEMFWKDGHHEPTEEEEDDSLWTRESEEKELRFLEEVAQHMVEYHRNSIRATEPVATFATPADLEAKFSNIGVEIECKSTDERVDIAQLTTALDAIVGASVRSSHPMFMNQLYAGVDPIALAGEWASSALNSNVHTYEVAPILTEIERAMLAKVAKLWRGENADGSALPTMVYSSLAARSQTCIL
jgi:glutamate decarboxylase